MKKFNLILLVAGWALLGRPGASVLSTTVAGMQPGTWAQLVVPNQITCLSDNGNTGSMLPYCHSMPWNPVTKQIDIVGQDHNGGGMKYVQYDEANNQFVTAMDPTIFSGGHGYDHIEVNPNTGHMYVFSSGATSPVRVYRKNAGSATFTLLPTIFAADVAYMGVAVGTCWWSGSFTGGGMQGSLMVYVAGECVNSVLRGAICAYNPLTDSWFYNRSARSPNGPAPGAGGYHAVIEYSPSRNVAVYGGGNGQDTRLWRMDSTGAVVELPSTPSGTRVGAGTGQGKLIADPATGNFLLLSAGQLWELNPSGAGSWTQKASPPSGVSNPSIPDANGIVIAVSLPEYGVVGYISQRGSSAGTFFLYKNAAGSMGLKQAFPRSKGTSLSGPSIVYDIRGRVMARLGAGIAWNRAGVPAGVYIVRTLLKDRFVSHRVVVD